MYKKILSRFYFQKNNIILKRKTIKNKKFKNTTNKNLII